jgi:hypothetical protein
LRLLGGGVEVVLAVGATESHVELEAYITAEEKPFSSTPDNFAFYACPLEVGHTTLSLGAL